MEQKLIHFGTLIFWLIIEQVSKGPKQLQCEEDYHRINC